MAPSSGDITPLRPLVHKVCGYPSRQPAQSVSGQQDGARESIPLKASIRETGNTLATRRTEFLNSLRLYRTFYGGLADQLCVSQLASADGLACWNGADIAKSYTLRVVGNGIKAQAANPEVKVKEEDPVINQIVDKLKHINQLLQGKSIPKFGTLDLIETGSGDGEGRGYSGDCDDEDGCGGSGVGEVKRKVTRVSKLAPDSGSDHRRHPQGEDSETGDRSSSQALRSQQAATLLVSLVLTLLLTTLHAPSWIISPLLDPQTL
ncbi:hypothetical protein J4Q44_G00052520 [Coregonus suidteri]|uniref:Glypican-5 n=1 Tax=Coregonus suidteri TaxID=861788 RepID=A0AAN8R2G0_9TELE